MTYSQISNIIKILKNEGCGSIIIKECESIDNFKVVCHSNISLNEVVDILNITVRKLSMIPLDQSSMNKGDFIIKCNDEKVCELTEYGAEYLWQEEPLMFAAVCDGSFSMFGVGDVPMLVYMATQMIVCMEGKIGNNYLKKFNPSMN